jgi:hypothetical protein
MSRALGPTEPEAKAPDSYREKHGLLLCVTKDWYLGLWNIEYWTGGRWAGPFKTRREARERLAELVDAEKADA